MRRLRQLATGLVLATTIFLLIGSAAQATPVPPGGPRQTGDNSEMIMSGTGPGQAVRGLIANPDNPFDPLDGYPTSNPSTGFTAKNEGFAGVIYGTPKGGGPALTLYCIDLLTNTYPGIGYELGTWTQAEVPNVGYVARILNSYYPAVPAQPSGLANRNQRAAAVQAATWFFSDRYVLRTSDPLHNAVAAIVAATIAAGPIIQPPPPSLTITPAAAAGPVGSVVGPFTVTSSVPAQVRAVGGRMFADAGSTEPIADGTTVPSGTQIWLRSTGPTTAVLQATARASVPSGNVYLYDGDTPGVRDAQKLILSKPATLETTVDAKAQFLADGSLVVSKTVAGPAAGQQGVVVVRATCDGTVLTPAFTIAAGSPAGTVSRTYAGIPAGSVCRIDEDPDGHTSAVSVSVSGDGQTVAVPAAGTATAALTDTYTATPGRLVISKTIAGPGAGRQSAVVVQPTCGGVDLPAFAIAAGSPGGTLSRRYDDIAAGTACTLAESVDGSNAAVSVTVAGSVGPVIVPAGGTAAIALSDTYQLRPGSLVINKSISGPAAGQQGPIAITVTCISDGITTALSPPFSIPAGATGTRSVTYTGIAGGSECTLVENPDGHTGDSAVIKGGTGRQIAIPPGGTATSNLTDTYLSGSLVVTKTIAGPAAGGQGPIEVSTVCAGTLLSPSLVIPAGAAAGTVSQEYPNVIAGASCTVTETADGATGTVTVVTAGSPQTVTISPTGTGSVDVTDTYAFVPGSLVVTKTIAGPSAGQQGAVTIQVDCGEQVSTPDFVIPAETTGAPARTYTGIPAGTTCAVVETVDGGSSTLSVLVAGSPQTAVITAGGSSAISLSDTYAPAPGSLIVTKTITGPAAGRQTAVSIEVACDGLARPTWVIPPAGPAGSLVRAYPDVPAGAICRVTESADGATRTVAVTVRGADQSVPIATGATVAVGIRNVYSDVDGALTITKSVSGPAAVDHGLIAIVGQCAGTVDDFAFTIAPGAPAGRYSHTVSDLPAGTICTVQEVSDGSTEAVAVAVVGGRQDLSITPAGLAEASYTDSFIRLADTGVRIPVVGLTAVGLGALLVGTVVLVVGRRRAERAN